MKNKGFTLIELLGVIIILALLMIIVFPSIINSVKKSSNKTDALTLDLIYNAADLFISEHKTDFPKRAGNKYLIELKDLVDEGFLVAPIKLSDNDLDITNSKCIQVIYQESYNYELKDNGTCEELIKYPLPNGYQEVEYIKSTGSQYIDTGFIPNQNTGIEIIADYTNLTQSTLIASRTAINQNAFGFLVISTGTTRYDYGTNTYNIGTITGKNTYKLDKNLAYLNGQLIYTFPPTTINSTFSLTMFSLNTGGTQGSYANGGKIYSCKIWDNGVLVRDFIPCYRKRDNVIGMYDMVNNVFYTNLGTGTFEKGDNVSQ